MSEQAFAGATAPNEAVLVLATHNPGKLAELQANLAPLVPDLDSQAIISAASLGGARARRGRTDFRR